MKKLTIIFAAMAICFGVTTDTFAQKGKPKPSPTPSSNIPVTAKYEQFGADGTFNRVTMDIDDPYTHGEENVSALFQIDNGSRDLTINLRNSANRSVQYDLSQVTEATADNAPGWNYQPQFFKTGMNVIGAHWAKETCQPVDGVYNCNYTARITTIGISVSGYSYNYRLLWNPEPENPSPANEPEATSYVNVNYQKDESGNDVFTITPLPNSASGRPIAGLEATYTGKGKPSVTNAGQYEMPFTLVVRPL